MRRALPEERKSKLKTDRGKQKVKYHSHGYGPFPGPTPKDGPEPVRKTNSPTLLCAQEERQGFL